MTNLQFFSMKDPYAKDQPSIKPCDVAIVDVSNHDTTSGRFLAAMMLDIDDGNGLVSHVFTITAMELRQYFIVIPKQTARTQNARIYAYALSVFVWQSNGKVS